MLFSFKKVMIKKLHSELEALLYESQEIKNISQYLTENFVKSGTQFQ